MTVGTIAKKTYEKAKNKWVIEEIMKCHRDIEQAQQRISDLEKGKIKYDDYDKFSLEYKRNPDGY